MFDQIRHHANLQPVALANLSNSGRRAIEPSSFMISQITPMGRQPASFAKSTALRVPARCSTPPGRARNGKTWPGCTVFRRGSRVGHDLDCPRPIRRADAGRDAVSRVNAYLKIRPEDLAVLFDHALDTELLQPLGIRWHADQPAPVFGHEVDRRGRDVLRGHDEVALVLPGPRRPRQ
jgi:hypothetical protein